jgi:hypothetical protein
MGGCAETSAFRRSAPVAGAVKSNVKPAADINYASKRTFI